jgi:hypothetical protein
MDPIPVPKLTVSFAVEVDIEYNSFGGRTKQDIAIALADDVENLIYEVTPDIKAVFVSITGIDSDDN